MQKTRQAWVREFGRGGGCEVSKKSCSYPPRHFHGFLGVEQFLLSRLSARFHVWWVMADFMTRIHSKLPVMHRDRKSARVYVCVLERAHARGGRG